MGNINLICCKTGLPMNLTHLLPRVYAHNDAQHKTGASNFPSGISIRSNHLVALFILSLVLFFSSSLVVTFLYHSYPNIRLHRAPAHIGLLLRDLNGKATRAIIGLFSVFIINKTRDQHFRAV